MDTHFDVVIIGGSYSGLSAAMALGRSRRKVLIIDSNKPCNRFTPHSQNFITHDGAKPADIAGKARQQVLAYPTINLTEDLAVNAIRTNNIFTITTENGYTYTAAKILFSTGVTDNLPDIEGVKDCWGVSAIHCPYCHGYEYSDTNTGILANGDAACHYALLVSNLTKTLSIFTNGPKDFTPEQLEKLNENNIAIYENPVKQVKHTEGYIDSIELADTSLHKISALYVRPQNTQHCTIPQDLGCSLNEQGYIVADMMQKTSVPGVFASGDCCTPMRSVSTAVAQGTMAGAAINAELCGERF